MVRMPKRFERSLRLLGIVFALASLGTVAFAQTGQGGSDGSGISEHQLHLRLKAQAATQNFRGFIDQWGSAYGVDPALIMAVITVESGGDPNALSSAGAMGLMQLMPATCVDYGVQQPFDPGSNIRGGTAMLANHFRRYKGDLQKVLAAYNAGIRHADNGSWVNISETRHYVPTVLAIYDALKGGAGVEPFKDSNQIPILPPEQNIDATLTVPAEDLMFQAIRWSPSIADPAGLVEDSRLEDAAATLLTEYQAGRLNSSNLQKLAWRAVRAAHRNPRFLRAALFLTENAAGFQARWNQEQRFEGNVLGLAHGWEGAKQVWIVLVANP